MENKDMMSAALFLWWKCLIMESIQNGSKWGTYTKLAQNIDTPLIQTEDQQHDSVVKGPGLKMQYKKQTLAYRNTHLLGGSHAPICLLYPPLAWHFELQSQRYSPTAHPKSTNTLKKEKHAKSCHKIRWMWALMELPLVPSKPKDHPAELKGAKN